MAASLYVVYLLLNGVVVRETTAHDFQQVSAICQEWWNENPRDDCTWEELRK